MSSTSNIPVMVLSFSEAERRNDFGLERQAATNIMQVVRDIDSKLVLDNLTKADGNCMIIAIVQQCQRPDILPHLPAHIQSLVQGTITPTMTSQFRVAVRQFVTENETGPVIQQISPFLTGSWDEYWSRMIQNRVWGDGVFLMCTAKLLEINILVVRHSSTKVLPYHLIRGRDVNPAGDSVDPSLYLGYTGSVFGQENHYQSLLPAADQDIFPPVFQIGSSPTQKQNKQQQRIESDRERQKKVRARTNARKLDPKVSDPKEDKAALKREKERMRKAAQRERKKAENLELYKAKHKESVANYCAAKKADNPDRGYGVSGMKNIGQDMFFAGTRDTCVTEIPNQDLDWAKFGDETTKAKVLFIADIKQLEVCLAQRIAANIFEFCKSSARYQKTVWTMSGLIVAEAIDHAGDESLNIFVDGPTLFGTNKKFNDLNKIHSAAEKIEGQTFIIDFDNFSGRKYAAMMSEIEDQD